MKLMNVEVHDEETTRMMKRMAVLRIATKHINLWVRQLEMKRKQIGELAGLMKLDGIKEEIEREKSLEKWAKTTTNHFTKKAKRMLYEEIDNKVWSGGEEETSSWCQRNKDYDDITEEEIEEMWKADTQDTGDDIRLNGKYVWETAKRVCDFINAHDDLINITTFGEYRGVMRKVMRVIKEAHNTQRKKRQSGKKKPDEEARKRTQRAKALIAIVKQGKMSKDEVMGRLEEIFGRGSSQERECLVEREKCRKDRGVVKKGRTV